MVDDQRMRVEYLKWPDRPHYTAEMLRIDDGVRLWGRMFQAGHSLRASGDKYPTVRDSLTLFQPGVWYTARWYRSRAEGERTRAARFSCYVDITTPPVVTADGIRLVDLDLDVALTWDGDVVVLDEDEFAERSPGYPGDVVQAARLATAEVVRKLTGRQSPFDTDVHRMWTLTA